MINELFTQELELEESYKVEGQRLLAKSITANMEGERAADSTTGRRLIEHHFDTVVDNVRLMFEDLARPKRGAKPSYAPIVEDLRNIYAENLNKLYQIVAYTTLGTTLNSVFANLHPISSIAQRLGRDLEEEAQLEKFLQLVDDSTTKKVLEGLDLRVGKLYRTYYAMQTMKDKEVEKLNWASGQQRLHDIPCVGLKGDFYYAPLSRSNETADYTGAVMAIDPSGRGKDETAYAIIKFLNGYLFLLEVGGYKDGYSESTLSALSHKCKYYGVNYCIYESNFGDGMFGQLLKPVMNRIHPCQIDEIKNSKQKELRIIDTLEPVMMRHKLIVNESVIIDDYKMYETDQHYSLFYQMTRISKERNSLAHDDRLDAVCMAVAFWLEYLDRDAQTGIDEQLEDKLMEWLDPDKGVLYIEETGLKTNHSALNRYNFLKNYF